MLSRVADSIYWMSRYIERAENVARFISVNLNLSLDMPGEDVQQWMPLVVTTGDDEAFRKLYDVPSKENVLKFLTFDHQNPNSIVASRPLPAKTPAACARSFLRKCGSTSTAST